MRLWRGTLSGTDGRPRAGFEEGSGGVDSNWSKGSAGSEGVPGVDSNGSKGGISDSASDIFIKIINVLQHVL